MDCVYGHRVNAVLRLSASTVTAPRCTQGTLRTTELPRGDRHNGNKVQRALVRCSEVHVRTSRGDLSTGLERLVLLLKQLIWTLESFFTPEKQRSSSTRSKKIDCGLETGNATTLLSTFKVCTMLLWKTLQYRVRRLVDVRVCKWRAARNSRSTLFNSLWDSWLHRNFKCQMMFCVYPLHTALSSCLVSVPWLGKQRSWN